MITKPSINSPEIGVRPLSPSPVDRCGLIASRARVLGSFGLINAVIVSPRIGSVKSAPSSGTRDWTMPVALARAPLVSLLTRGEANRELAQAEAELTGVELKALKAPNGPGMTKETAARAAAREKARSIGLHRAARKRWLRQMHGLPTNEEREARMRDLLGYADVENSADSDEVCVTFEVCQQHEVAASL